MYLYVLFIIDLINIYNKNIKVKIKKYKLNVYYFIVTKYYNNINSIINLEIYEHYSICNINFLKKDNCKINKNKIKKFFLIN